MDNYKPCVIGKDGQCMTCKDDDPMFSFRFHKGFGVWAGLNTTYGILCIWLPFVISYITLPKIFKRPHPNNAMIYLGYFSIHFRPNSFGLYFEFDNFWGLRLPFVDIYLNK